MTGPTNRMLQFFEYDHLASYLQEACKPFRALAHDIVFQQPDNPERTKALDKLLEARDCVLRAALYRD